MVKPRGCEQFKAFIEGVQKFQPVMLGVEHGAGVWVEAEQGGRRVVTVRNLPQLLQHSAMARVHTVKRSDGQNRALGV